MYHEKFQLHRSYGFSIYSGKIRAKMAGNPFAIFDKPTREIRSKEQKWEYNSWVEELGVNLELEENENGAENKESNKLCSVYYQKKVPLTDFTLSNARRFYSSMGNPTGVKGLKKCTQLVIIC